MNKLAELEKKYEELGKEIEKLKLAEAESKVGFEDDCIFLLSIDEYKKYKNKIPHMNCWWWLRSPGHIFNRAASVYIDGSFISYGFNVRDDQSNGVRPALKIKDHTAIKCKDGACRIIYCGVTWVQIDENLYISEVPVMFNRFDEDDNNYETSEVRKKLLEWFDNRQSW